MQVEAAGAGDSCELKGFYGVEENIFHISSQSWSPYEPEFGSCFHVTSTDDLVSCNASEDEIPLWASSTHYHCEREDHSNRSAVCNALPADSDSFSLNTAW